MKLLLDTHALIWFLENDPQLSARALSAIGDPANFCHVSDATAWESAIKLSLGKLRLPLPFERLFPDRLLELGFHPLPIRPPHLQRIVGLPFHHKDPFDLGLLIAQAQVEGMTLVSNDLHFPAYDVSLLW